MSLRQFNLETGETIFESDPSKPYEIRHPKGLLPEHAPIRRFLRVKPRYRRLPGGLLMMVRKKK